MTTHKQRLLVTRMFSISREHQWALGAPGKLMNMSFTLSWFCVKMIVWEPIENFNGNQTPPWDSYITKSHFFWGKTNLKKKKQSKPKKKRKSGSCRRDWIKKSVAHLKNEYKQNEVNLYILTWLAVQIYEPSLNLAVLCLLSRFSRVRLFVMLWTVARQALLSVGFSRQE